MAKSGLTYWLITLLAICLWPVANAQEEGSAELYTEAYTDRFQELFFEALKEKGIENYDRAQALLLQCKQMEENNPVVDHELAKVLLLAGEYPLAEAYAIKALMANPEEYWYLNTLMEILSREYRDFESLNVEVPSSSPEFKMNLASWYMGQGKLQKASNALKGLPESPRAKLLNARIEMLTRASESAGQVVRAEKVKEAQIQEGSVEDYRQRLETFEREQDWPQLLELSAEAVELFPLQPFFYYQQGRAYLNQDRIENAISSLLMGEELLIGSSDLNALIYRALAEAYTRKGDTQKANYYANKLKEGL